MIILVDLSIMQERGLWSQAGVCWSLCMPRFLITMQPYMVSFAVISSHTVLYTIKWSVSIRCKDTENGVDIQNVSFMFHNKHI